VIFCGRIRIFPAGRENSKFYETARNTNAPMIVIAEKGAAMIEGASRQSLAA
jgi:hypothetical protein